MATAFVLISSALGSDDSIIKELRKLPEVKEVEGIYGVYDIIVKVASGDIDHVKHAVTDKIRRMNGVRSTNTLIVVEGQGNQ
ncbi:MAG: Lrp/AsnC family transcriptional regulator [Nitrososphaerales archaeon]